MTEITIDAGDIQILKNRLFDDGVENCAILYASQVERSDGVSRLLVRKVEIPLVDEYLSRDEISAVLSPAFVARVSKFAKTNKLSLIFAHSHPGESAPEFSRTDDIGENDLSRFMAYRHPDNLHAALVISAGGFKARVLGESKEIRVVSLGDHREVLFDPNSSLAEVSNIFDRQVRAFGLEGQRAIQKLCVAIVGLGGTGSLVAQQLVHLGVRNFILVDPDVIESTNLNRVVGTFAGDLHREKVEVAARYIQQFSPEAKVVSVAGDIIRERIAKTLCDADFIFGCTDSHGSRSVLQQISYQYLIPCIDVGTTIISSSGSVTGIFGRVQMLSPSNACFACSGLLNSEEVRRDMMSAYEKKMDPYIQGAREPAPAVISLNGTVVSLAITMFMSAVAGVPSPSRYILYDAMKSMLRNVRSKRQENCYICSRSGTFARGDLQRLFARQD